MENKYYRRSRELRAILNYGLDWRVDWKVYRDNSGQALVFALRGSIISAVIWQHVVFLDPGSVFRQIFENFAARTKREVVLSWGIPNVNIRGAANKLDWWTKQMSFVYEPRQAPRLQTLSVPARDAVAVADYVAARQAAVLTESAIAQSMQTAEEVDPGLLTMSYARDLSGDLYYDAGFGMMETED